MNRPPRETPPRFPTFLPFAYFAVSTTASKRNCPQAQVTSNPEPEAR